MKIRKLSFATYRRNPCFWMTRQDRGEEIQLMQMGRTVGVLHAAPYPEEPNRNPSLRQRQHRMIQL